MYNILSSRATESSEERKFLVKFSPAEWLPLLHCDEKLRSILLTILWNLYFRENDLQKVRKNRTLHSRSQRHISFAFCISDFFCFFCFLKFELFLCDSKVRKKITWSRTDGTVERTITLLEVFRFIYIVYMRFKWFETWRLPIFGFFFRDELRVLRE